MFYSFLFIIFCFSWGSINAILLSFMKTFCGILAIRINLKSSLKHFHSFVIFSESDMDSTPLYISFFVFRVLLKTDFEMSESVMPIHQFCSAETLIEIILSVSWITF